MVRVHDRIGIQAARNHGKSANFCYGYPLWQMWKEPQNDGLIICDTLGQAKEHLEIIKEGKLFISDRGEEFRLPPAATLPWLRGIVPDDWEMSWGKVKIKMKRGWGSSVGARGFGVGMRGGHPRWIVVDDPFKDDVAFSEVARTKAERVFFRSIGGMLPARGGQLIAIGTPLHATDFLQKLHDNPRYEARRYPAEFDVYVTLDGDVKVNSEAGELVAGEGYKVERRQLWSARFNAQDLADKKREIGPLAYAQEFLLKPTTSENSLFPEELFEEGRVLLRHAMLRPTLSEIQLAGWTVFFGVDLAISAKVAADSFVITVLGVDDRGNRTLIDQVTRKGLGFKAQQGLLFQLAGQYEPDLITVEANAYQAVFGSEVNRLSDLPVWQFTTGVEKHHLAKGVPVLRTRLENGKLKLPIGDGYSAGVVRSLIEEMVNFSWVQGKLQGVGSHDDRVMSLYLCEKGVQKMGFTFAGMEDDDGGADEDERGARNPSPESTAKAAFDSLIAEFGSGAPPQSGGDTGEFSLGAHGDPYEVDGPLIFGDWDDDDDDDDTPRSPQKPPEARGPQLREFYANPFSRTLADGVVDRGELLKVYPQDLNVCARAFNALQSGEDLPPEFAADSGILRLLGGSRLRLRESLIDALRLVL